MLSEDVRSDSSDSEEFSDNMSSSNDEKQVSQSLEKKDIKSQATNNDSS